MTKKAHTDTSRILIKFAAWILLGYCLLQLTRTLMGWAFLILGAILAASVMFLLKIYPRWRKSEAYKALRMADVDDMSGEQFERYVGELLKKQGYKTEMTPARNDYGVDIVAEREGVRYAVQCKRRGENISRDAVSDAVAGKHYYKCGQAMVVTNRYFRSGAKELAGASQCELVDRDALVGWIQTFQAEQTPATMTSTKARSIAIGLAIGSSVCFIVLFFVDMANSARQAAMSQAATTPTATVQAVVRPKLSAERKSQQNQLINEMIRQGATKEQIAEARSRLNAMTDAEFQALLESRKLMAEEQRRIEQGEDESQKPPEERGQPGSSDESQKQPEQQGQTGSSEESKPRTKYIVR